VHHAASATWPIVDSSDHSGWCVELFVFEWDSTPFSVVDGDVERWPDSTDERDRFEYLPSFCSIFQPTHRDPPTASDIVLEIAVVEHHHHHLSGQIDHRLQVAEQ